MLFTHSSSSRQSFAKDPAVVHFKGAYYLYFSSLESFGGERDKLVVGIARSADMEHWEFVQFMPLTQPCEQNGVGAPGAYVEGDRVHLFYQTYGNWKNDAICHAVSHDGVHFEKDKTNPIFSPTEDWCCGRAIDADVLAFDGKLFLYFATRDHEMKIQMQGCAYAPLGCDYARDRWTQATNASILYPELLWEGQCIEAAATLVHNGKVYLFYGGSYNCTPQQIGYAVSSDGIHFEKPQNTPFLPAGNPGDWNACESGHPYAFVDDDGRIYLFYQGSPDGGKSWYLSRCEIGFRQGVPHILQFYNNKTEVSS